MRELHILDVHTNVTAVEEILAKEKRDFTIFHGDWFDDWKDSPGRNLATAVYLKHLIDTTDGVFLLGNHDAHYRFPANGFMCSGWTYDKKQAINSVMTPEYWQRFRLFYKSQGWLHTHAGLHPSLISPLRQVDMDYLKDQQANALGQASMGLVHPWLAAGRSRGGYAHRGGVNWLDWSEFKAIRGVNQLVGHSCGKEVRIKKGRGTINYCLDTRMKHYAIIEGGEIEVKELA